MVVPSRRAVAVTLVLALPLPALARIPNFDDVPQPEAYGEVVLRGSGSAPAVVFQHWQHRRDFTCRVCHVDVAFAMEAGGSEISREGNASGMFCGACHDGKKNLRGQVVFAACSKSGELQPRCARCHSGAPGARRRREYQQLTRNLPTYAGGYVDWEKVEVESPVKPLDHVDGISVERPPLKNDQRIPLEARDTWVGDVIFSHRKHASWNGCEVCHPTIFSVGGREAGRFRMRDIEEGRSCGVCHRTVAFPLAQCHRCHKDLPGNPG
jgi:c(7)-type cytochrome triheme protein